MVKNTRKWLAFSFLAICGMTLTLVAVSASSANINTKVKAYQNYSYVARRNKDTTGSISSVNLTKMGNKEISFSAKSTTEGIWSDVTIVRQTNRDYIINYVSIYGEGQEVEARFRNHNWTTNAGVIKGVYDYK